MKETIAVALSGGVDSAVAAALLIERGYDVFGVSMLLGDFTDDVEAKQVARTLGIPYFGIDLKATFKSKIIDYFLKEYLCGRTPNPCIVCNRLIKFGELLGFALKKGATHLATGHYAKVEYSDSKERFLVFKAADAAKDQSYMFWSLSQEQLSHLKMPLGLLKKVDIRGMAGERGLPAKKLESQEVCFIPKGDYRSFLLAEVREKILPGEIVDEEGEILGKHKGLP
ncbi:MAG TPA: tRNA 2-thiouridine(34) synthase MnmA, partial [Actinobacteria bacterium]|nr:tRNA 2-thiouridine(34) synthase MnmA [Actinomycetota bacterium]